MEHNQITPEWIVEQRKICEAATPGPWEHCGNDVYSTVNQRLGMVLMSAFENPITDTSFAAAARTALPAALDALEAAQKEIARLTAERDAAVKDFKASIETDHCQYCVNTEKCERKAEKAGTYAVPEKGCGFKWKGMSVTNASTGAESEEHQ